MVRRERSRQSIHTGATQSGMRAPWPGLPKEGCETGPAFPKGPFLACFDTISNSNAERKSLRVETQERNHFLKRKRTWGEEGKKKKAMKLCDSGLPL